MLIQVVSCFFLQWHVLRVRILAMGLNHVPRVPWELISRRRVKSLASLVRVCFLLTGLEQAPQRTVKVNFDLQLQNQKNEFFLVIRHNYYLTAFMAHTELRYGLFEA